MSFQDLAALSSTQQLQHGIHLVRTLYASVENVKVYRQQCLDLSNRCVTLLLALQENAVGLEGTPALRAVDDVEAVISRIRSRVQAWAAHNKVKSFVHQTDIKQGIDASYRELETCLRQFNVALHLDASRRRESLAAIRERDHLELREMMHKLLQDMNTLKEGLSNAGPENVQSVIRVIQQELQDPTLEMPQENQLRQGLRELQPLLSLPVMADLTGQVTKTSEHAVAMGSFNDIFIGQWLGEDVVALGFPRLMNQSPAAQLRFQKQVEIWRFLQHPNVLRLYGIAFIGEYVYSVSPWMDNGNAITYVQNHPEVDRVRLLCEVASGLEYLHSNKVVHGDLRGMNILISDTGKSCICDFGLSQVIEEEANPGPQTTTAGNYRWLAPEMIEPDPFAPSKPADVWSFGMLCLELLTGVPPYSNHSRDASVILDIVRGKLPERPGASAAGRGLTDALWELMLRCWKKAPEERPTMFEVRVAMKNMLPDKSPGIVTSPLPIPRASLPISLRRTHQPSLSTASSSSGDMPPLSGLSITRPQAIDVKRTRASLSPYTPEAISPMEEPVIGSPQSVPSYLSPMSASHIRRTSGILSAPISASPPSLLFKPPPSPASIHSAPSTAASADGLLQDGARSSNDGRRDSRVVSLPSFSDSSSARLEFSPLHSVASRASSMSGDPSFILLDLAAMLDRAVTDPQAIVRRNAEGCVDAGTLEGLVGQLLADTGKDQVEYRSAFLASYRAFTTSEEVFNILQRRFDDMDRMAVITTEHRVSTRYSILLLMQTWLKMEQGDMNAGLLQRIHDFAASIKSSQTMETAAREIVAGVVEKRRKLERALQSPPLRSPSGTTSGRRPVSKASDLVPTDLAIAFTLIEGDLYSRITQTDCVIHLQQIVGTRHIDAARKTNNRIVNWVKKSVLRSDEVQSRSEVFKFFVNTAEECRKLRNFSSMSAIVNALQSSSITALVITHDNSLNKQEKRVLQRLDSLLEPERNHRAYREALRASDAPCVPWLAVHLRDLNSVFRSHAPAVEVDEHALINFARITKLIQHVREVLRHKPPDLAAHRGAGPLDYLQRQLKSIPDDQSIEDAFKDRSAALARQERVMHEQRLPELRALGFTTGPAPARGASSSSASSSRPPSRDLFSPDPPRGRA